MPRFSHDQKLIEMTKAKFKFFLKEKTAKKIVLYRLICIRVRFYRGIECDMHSLAKKNNKWGK
jgi:hypothetical protein